MDIGFIILLVVIAAQIVAFCIKKWGNRAGKGEHKNNPEEPKKLNISELVMSFIETYKDNPKRFEIEVNVKDQSDFHLLQQFQLTDRKNGNAFVVLKEIYGSRSYSEGIRSRSKNIEFLTTDEIEFIFRTIQDINTNRKRKIQEYKINKQRSRYIKDYCKENI